MIPPVPHVEALEPYALANLSAPEHVTPLVLSQNESLRPPSPRVAEAVARAMDNAHRYSDPDWLRLRTTLAKHHGLKAENILVGAGSLDLIATLTRAYTGAGRSVLAPRHAYPFFCTAAHMAGARFDTAEESDGAVSVDALIHAAKPDTALVFVANPGNPTGSLISRAALHRLRGGLADSVLLVIDEAYGEFADHLDQCCVDMVGTGNTIVLRTFSKAFGLAGLRIGWGAFPPDVAVQVRKLLNPNNISAASQAAACAALRDTAYMKETCALTARLRDQAIARLRRAGFLVSDSHTNFVTITLPAIGQAEWIEKRLRDSGIFLRRQTAALLPQTLRMTIGPAPAQERALKELEHL
ncbi:MAG: histidinol-phosphate transaminase [Pseudomonadota bacterium]